MQPDAQPERVTAAQPLTRPTPQSPTPHSHLGAVPCSGVGGRRDVLHLTPSGNRSGGRRPAGAGAPRRRHVSPLGRLGGGLPPPACATPGLGMGTQVGRVLVEGRSGVIERERERGREREMRDGHTRACSEGASFVGEDACTTRLFSRTQAGGGRTNGHERKETGFFFCRELQFAGTCEPAAVRITAAAYSTKTEVISC